MLFFFYYENTQVVEIDVIVMVPRCGFILSMIFIKL